MPRLFIHERASRPPGRRAPALPPVSRPAPARAGPSAPHSAPQRPCAPSGGVQHPPGRKSALSAISEGGGRPPLPPLPPLPPHPAARGDGSFCVILMRTAEGALNA